MGLIVDGDSPDGRSDQRGARQISRQRRRFQALRNQDKTRALRRSAGRAAPGDEGRLDVNEDLELPNSSAPEWCIIRRLVIRCTIAGASGYSGAELVRWLHGHPEVELVDLAAGRRAGELAAAVLPHLASAVEATLATSDWDRLGRGADVVFLALPHGEALAAAGRLIDAGARVIDLGADFRLRSPSAYRRWYGGEHTAAALLAEAAYGLTECHRKAVAGARLVANPGCYPTASALALKPLLEQFGDRVCGAIVIDAKSGVSGAGRNAR